MERLQPTMVRMTPLSRWAEHNLHVGGHWFLFQEAVMQRIQRARDGKQKKC